MKNTLQTIGFLLFLSLPFVLISQTLSYEFHDESSNFGNSLGQSVALSSDGNIIAISVPGAPGAGQVKVFKKNNNHWTQIGNDLNTTEVSGSFGSNISLSTDGNTIAIGAHRNTDDTGLVQVFHNINDSWIQIGENITGEESGDQFGDSVALSDDGNTVAIGAPGNFTVDSLSTFGYVKVFQNINDSWIQTGDVLNGEELRSYFGNAVALSPDGNILAIGVPGILSATIWHVKVFQNINNTWTQLGSNINGEAQRDRFGRAIDFSSDGKNTLAIGAPGSDSRGTTALAYVKVFNFSNNTWNTVGKTIYSKQPRDLFGTSVSLSSDGSIVAIGAPDYRIIPDEAFPTGQVKIFESDGNIWHQAGNELIGDTLRGQHFGQSVSVSSDGKTLAIGDFAYSSRRGKVYIYENIPSSSVQIKEKQLTIYPNPTSDLLHIDGSPVNQIYLFDSFGSILKIENKPTSTIDISTLSAGVYFLLLEMDGEFYNSKIVKQ